VFHPYRLSFVKDLVVEEAEEASETRHLLLHLRGRQVRVRKLSPVVREVVDLLAGSGVTERQLADRALPTGGSLALAQAYAFLQRCTAHGLVQYAVCADGEPLITALPLSAACRFELPYADDLSRYTLSRFAYCRRDHGHLVLESPLSHARVLLHGWHGAALVAALTKPLQEEQIGLALPALSAEDSSAVVRLLASVGMLTRVREDGKTQEDESLPLVQWEFHDLLFHTRSRPGRHDAPVGSTNRFLGQIEPLPAVKSLPAERVVYLPHPDMMSLMRHDCSLTEALERRRSQRVYGERPITLQQLGEFFYRTARAKPLHATGDAEERFTRPYPGGGGVFELELYLAVNQCENLSAGLYYYHPTTHQLAHLGERDAQLDMLLKSAGEGTGSDLIPQVLIIITARFQRLAWHYQSTAYALVLKDVGVLFQTMYLVATAMDLAPCALGTGDSDLFARVAGTDYYAETSVGEFLLGSSAPPG
jgi:SagB-type dehydrogenase family enzyme